ncbi:hypothetical protein [Arhodomonas sp. AD133]|uniref:hypothetical protein n=1 Tax=Arhodomonas sp. AD133 TaxID=3415009 RepID=UPI003EB9C88D
MPRTVTTKVQTATQGPVTHPRRLVELRFPSATLRLSTDEDIPWNGHTWQASGVRTPNLSETPASNERAAIVLPNLDRAASALVLAERVVDSPCRIWQLYGKPPYASDDPVLLFEGYVGEVAEIADTQVRLECRSWASGNAGKSPRVQVGPRFVTEPMAPGTEIRWGEVTIVVEAPR